VASIHARALTLIFPAEPCQMLPEKSSAWMDAGRKCATSDAGNVATITASTATSPMRTSGR
jgi:hypothetical protein